MSKGHRQRPASIPQDELAKRWEQVFGKATVYASSETWTGEVESVEECGDGSVVVGLRGLRRES